MKNKIVRIQPLEKILAEIVAELEKENKVVVDTGQINPFFLKPIIAACLEEAYKEKAEKYEIKISQDKGQLYIYKNEN